MKSKSFSALVWLSLFLVLLISGCVDDDDSSDSKDDDADPLDDDDTASPDDDNENESMTAGFAKVDITPQISVKLAGYDMFFFSEDTCRWSTEIHDPIYAQAVALDDPKNGKSVILIVLDIIGLMRPDVEQIQNEITNMIPVRADEVIVAATHSHHGPDAIGIWGVMIPPISGRQEEVMDMILAGAVQAATEAWDARIPAHFEYAQGTLAEWHENIIEDDPQRTLDDAFSIFAAYDDQDNLMGTLCNWSAHPTVMGQESTAMTSDFPGVYYRLMNEQFGGVHLFVNGAIGAMVQPSNKWRDPDEWDEVEETGAAVADKASSLLAEATPIDNASIDFFDSRDAGVRLTNPLFPLMGSIGLIPRPMPPLGEYAACLVTSFAIGPVHFGTMPGEFAPDYGVAFREIMGGDAQFLIGLGNDWIGYVLTPRQAAHPAYWYERILSPSAYAGESVKNAYEQIWQ